MRPRALTEAWPRWPLQGPRVGFDSGVAEVSPAGGRMRTPWRPSPSPPRPGLDGPRPLARVVADLAPSPGSWRPSPGSWPRSLESIDDQAFEGCTQLQRADLPRCVALATIHAFAFARCTALASLDLSGCHALVSIARSALRGCEARPLVLRLRDRLNGLGELALLRVRSLRAVGRRRGATRRLLANARPTGSPLRRFQEAALPVGLGATSLGLERLRRLPGALGLAMPALLGGPLRSGTVRDRSGRLNDWSRSHRTR